MVQPFIYFGTYVKVGLHLLVWAAVAACAVLLFLVSCLWVSGVRPVVVQSGSMNPTISVGSLMLSHKVEASRLREGDIATATSSGKRMVTHRVVGVIPHDDGMTEVWMKGDANRTKDETPYMTKSVWMPEHIYPRLGKWFMFMRTTPAQVGIGCLMGICIYLFSRNTKNRAKALVTRQILPSPPSLSVDAENLETVSLQLIENAKKQKMALSASISHELRTPLTSIVGYLEMLVEGELGKTSKQQLKAMKSVRRNAERMVGFVGDLSLASQIELGTLCTGDQAPVDAADIVLSVVDDLMPAAKEARVEIRTVVETDMTPVPGNPRQLELCIRHIISNAISISTSERGVTVRAFHDSDVVTLTVSDSGGSLKPDQIAALFERFFTGTWTDDDTASQSGIGLAVAKGIVDAHNGSIRVDCVGTAGSTITVKLPAPSLTPIP